MSTKRKTRTKEVSILDLQVGDIVHAHGMRLRLIGERRYAHTACGVTRPAVSFGTELLNEDEVRAANVGVANGLPMSWAKRWVVQGNDLVTHWKEI